MLGIYLFFITTASSSVNEKCPVSKYRNADGRCNNVLRPSWGKKNSPFLQLSMEVQSKVIHLSTIFNELLNLYPTLHNIFKVNHIRPNGLRLGMWQNF